MGGLRFAAGTDGRWTPVLLTNRGRLVRISDGKLFDQGVPNIFLKVAYDEKTGRLWTKGATDRKQPSWCAKLSMNGDDLNVEMLLVSSKENPIDFGQKPIFYEGRIFGDKQIRDPDTGYVFGKDASFQMNKHTPWGVPKTKHIKLIANGHVYGVDEISAHWAKRNHGKETAGAICEVFTTDGKKVATNFLSVGPWNAEQEKRLIRNGFPKSFSYSCGFNFGPDCIYIASQDYLFCIGK